LENFDKWNTLKKKIQNEKKYIHFKTGEIYFINIGQNIGYEVYGKGNFFLRPVLIYKKLSRYSFLGIPLTSKKKEGSYFYNFSYKKDTISTAIFSQMRVFDAKRLAYHSGHIKKEDFENLEKKLKDFINITSQKGGGITYPQGKQRNVEDIIPQKRYKINPLQKDFIDFLIDIDYYFQNNSKTIHKARNELKIIPYNGMETVVKSFRIPNIIRRIIYTFFRDSKAKKSYEYSLKIGDFTPEPIGYIEFYKNSLLERSYFVAKKFEYDFTMAHIRDDQPNYKNEVLEAFAIFSYKLHQNNIWHSDYSAGNILVKKQNNSYSFKIVDINRMKFFKIKSYKGLENFNKLWFNEEDLTTIAKAYAKEANLDETKAIQEILYHDKKLKDFVLRKRAIRAFFKGKK
jgi:hypothetical protein